METLTLDPGLVQEVGQLKVAVARGQVLSEPLQQKSLGDIFTIANSSSTNFALNKATDF